MNNDIKCRETERCTEKEKQTENMKRERWIEIWREKERQTNGKSDSIRIWGFICKVVSRPLLMTAPNRLLNMSLTLGAWNCIHNTPFSL
jgi:hypothetical protein